MDFNIVQEGLNLVPLDSLPHALSGGDWSINALVVAQQFKDNLGGNVMGIWNNFVKTGQIWALLIGLFVGYVFRSFTSF